jgi:hypothetical protein
MIMETSKQRQKHIMLTAIADFFDSFCAFMIFMVDNGPK